MATSSETDRALGMLVEEQAALRRVATLVASSPPPEDVFQAVAAEAGRLLGGNAVAVRFEERGGVIVGRWDETGATWFDVGPLVPYSDPDVPVYVASQHGAGSTTARACPASPRG